MWCKTRLLNSGGQFDQLCNLIDGTILARALVELSLPTMMGVPRPRCVRACVRVRVRVCVCVRAGVYRES